MTRTQKELEKKIGEKVSEQTPWQMRRLKITEINSRDGSV